MYQIPLFDLNYGKEEEQAVLETLRSKWISMGPKCVELEKRFAEMLGVELMDHIVIGDGEYQSVKI